MHTDLSAEPVRSRLMQYWRSPVLRLVLIILIVECLVFQWSSFIPMPTVGSTQIPAESQILEGLTRDSIRPQLLTADENKVHTVTVALHGQTVRSVFLDAYSNIKGPLKYQVSVIDQASSVHYLLGEGELVSGIDRSRSLLVWPSGPVYSVRFTFPMKTNEQLHLNRLILNRRIPFRPSLLRMLLLLILGLLVHALFTSSVFLKTASVNDLEQRLLIFALGFLIFVSCIWLTTAASTVPFFNVSKTTGDLYNKDLTDALLSKRFDLLINPPAELAALANPYDPAQRAALKTGVLWDAAYFNGRYYVYFGIVPSLLLFVPFKLLSGYYFQTAWAVFLFGALSLLLLIRVLRRFLFAFFPTLTFRYHFILSLLVPAVSYVGWALARPKFYELAIVSGFFFLMLGLNHLACVVFNRTGRSDRSLFREAVLATKGDLDLGESDDQAEVVPVVEAGAPVKSSDRISIGHLFLACLSFALSIGCRPVLIFTFIPLAAILLVLLKRSRQTRQTLELLFFSALPILVVAFLLARYNQIRFGSIFEFGSRYQLTVTDIQSRGIWAPARILPGLGHYLLTPPVINTLFPFIHFPAGRIFSHSTYFYTDGRTVGLLTLPFLSILLVWPFLRRAWTAASQALRLILTVSLATGLLILVFNSMAGGGIGRYIIDFAIWLVIPAMVVWLLLIGRAQTNNLAEWHFTVFLIAAAMTLFICLMLFLQGENDRIEQQTPYLFELIRRTLAFWLP